MTRKCCLIVISRWQTGINARLSASLPNERLANKNTTAVTSLAAQFCLKLVFCFVVIFISTLPFVDGFHNDWSTICAIWDNAIFKIQVSSLENRRLLLKYYSVKIRIFKF